MGYSTTGTTNKITITSIEKKEFDKRIQDMALRGYKVIKEGQNKNEGSLFFNRITYWAKLEKINSSIS